MHENGELLCLFTTVSSIRRTELLYGGCSVITFEQMKEDGMNPGTSSTLRYKGYKSLGDLFKCRFLFAGSGVGPQVLHF